MSTDATSAGWAPDEAPRLSPLPDVTLSPSHPFPGLAPFEERHAQFFKGRETVISDLQCAVENDPLTLLYGASGLGKTSLLAAGLFPALREAGYLPFSLRLDFGTSKSLVASVLDQIKRSVAATKGIEAEVELDFAGTADAPAYELLKSTLWGFLQVARFWNVTNHRLTPVLVFDQFEELFTLGRFDERVKPLVTELANAVYNEVPTALREPLRRGELGLSSFEPARFKCILAVREDFMPEFDELRAELPALMLRRYRLTRLGGTDAVKAICGPSPGLVSAEVAAMVVRRLARENRRSHDEALAAGTEPDQPDAKLQVEPALLSLFCQGLNKKRIEAKAETITAELVNQSAAVIIRDFYKESLAGVDQKTRDFVENELISSSGFRTTVALSTAAAKGADLKHLRLLIERRLLRREERFGETHVELIHDVLTAEVRHLRDERKQEEERQRLDAEKEKLRKQAEAEAQLAAQRTRDAWREAERKRDKRVRIVAGVVMAVVASASAAAWFYVQLELIPEQKRVTERALLANRIREMTATLTTTSFPPDCAKLQAELRELTAEDGFLAQQAKDGIAAAGKCLDDGSRRAQELEEERRSLLDNGHAEEAVVRHLEAAIQRAQTTFKFDRKEILPDERLLFTLRGHEAVPRSVTISSGDAVAYSAADDGIIAWDLSAGQRLQKLRLPDWSVRHLSMTKQDERELLVAAGVVGKGRGGVAVWDTAQIEKEPTKVEFGRMVADALLLPGAQLATVYEGISWQAFKQSSPAKTVGQQNFFTRLAWNAGARIAATGDSPRAFLWESPPRGRQSFVPGSVSAKAAKVVVAAFDPKSERLALGLANGEVALHSLEPGVAPVILRSADESWVAALAFCRDASFLVAGLSRRDKRGEPAGVVRLASSATARVTPLFNVPGAALRDLALSGDCKHVVSAWSDGTIRVSSVGEATPLPEQGNPVELLRQLRRRLGLQAIDSANASLQKTALPAPDQVAPEKR